MTYGQGKPGMRDQQPGKCVIAAAGQKARSQQQGASELHGCQRRQREESLSEEREDREDERERG